MPDWGEVLKEINDRAIQGEVIARSSLDAIRHKYLDQLHQHTGRNVIAYYSGWLSKPAQLNFEINDEDKNGFMMAIHKMKDRTKGLDLILHTPGGSIASTQSIVDYLRKMFGRDIRAIVPQIAMSAGTMLACSCRSILMGKHSNLGPIDPHMRGIPAPAVIREFERACEEVKNDASRLPIWRGIIEQIKPAFLTQCQNAIDWSDTFVKDQLADVMFWGDEGGKEKAAQIVAELTSEKGNHDRHIHFEECESMGLVMESIEDPKNEILQDLILTVHHCYMHVFMNAPPIKIIENHLGNALIKHPAQQRP